MFGTSGIRHCQYPMIASSLRSLGRNARPNGKFLAIKGDAMEKRP